MKKINHYIIPSFLVIFLFAGCGKNSPPPVVQQPAPPTSATQEINPAEISSKPDKNGFLSYKNKTMSFQIKFPEDWSQKIITDNVSIYFLSPESSYADPANLNITITPLKDPTALEIFTAVSIKEMEKTFTPFKLLVSKPVQLSTLPAYQVIYTGAYGGQHFKNLQIWAIKDGKSYLLSFGGSAAAYDKFVKTAQQMIETFTIL